MQPRKPSSDEPQGALFRMELTQLIDLEHPLARLAGIVDWARFDEGFSPLYEEGTGRPAISTRLMVGLHYLKHLHQLSDEDVVEHWVENPVLAILVRREILRAPVADPSHLDDALAKEDRGCGRRDHVAGNDRGRVGDETDPACQPAARGGRYDGAGKSGGVPIDAKLYDDMRRKLVLLANGAGLNLRQSYARCGEKRLAAVGRSARGHHGVGIRKHTRKLKTYLGRVLRDIERKLPEAARSETWQQAFELARHMLMQQRTDTNKIYSVHAPDTECMAKGKLCKPYEFGHKVGIVTTAREQFVLGALTLHHKPYDGHTLAGCLEQVERLMGQPIGGEIYVDKGYRGHNYVGPAKVFIAKPKKKQEPALRRWYNPRNGIEAAISHMKNDGWLGHNYLKGTMGNRVNALMAACGQNLRKLLHWLVLQPATAFCALIALFLLPAYFDSDSYAAA